jgi:hypothetical protein
MLDEKIFYQSVNNFTAVSIYTYISSGLKKCPLLHFTHGPYFPNIPVNSPPSFFGHATLWFDIYQFIKSAVKYFIFLQFLLEHLKYAVPLWFFAR